MTDFGVGTPLDCAGMSQEDKDKMRAGIHLRRYADGRGNVLEELKTGAMYIRGARNDRPTKS